MRIGFLLRAPTQFDAPFFRHASSVLEGDLSVIYTNADELGDRAFDSELSREVSWGIDLLGGYPYSVLPHRRRAPWLLRKFRRETYDLLIISGYRERALIIAAVVAKLMSIPVALRLDTPSFKREGRRKRLIKRALYAILRRLYDHFLPVGSSAAEFLESMGIAAEQMSFFPYSVDVDHFRRRSTLDEETRRRLRGEYRLPLDEPVIVAVTKFSEREAPWDLLRAYCTPRPPGATLWLIGDGPKREALEAYVRESECTGVVFGGYIPYLQLPLAYGIADAFVHPAPYEPWGVSVQEALACGLPVLVSSMVGAGRDFVVPGRNGFIYRAGDPDDLRHKLGELLPLGRSAEALRATEERFGKFAYPVIWQRLGEVAGRYSSRRRGRPRLTLSR